MIDRQFAVKVIYISSTMCRIATSLSRLYTPIIDKCLCCADLPWRVEGTPRSESKYGATFLVEYTSVNLMIVSPHRVRERISSLRHKLDITGFTTYERKKQDWKTLLLISDEPNAGGSPVLVYTMVCV